MTPNHPLTPLSYLFLKRKKAGKSTHFLLPFAFCFLPSVVGLTGCGIGKVEAEAQAPTPRVQRQSITAVDVAIARTGVLQEAPTYIGTTKPYREISLRSQVEGRLLNLTVNIGDRVVQGQILAQLDEAILLTAVTQVQAELAARESEVLRAQTQVSNARAKAEQARVEFQQAKSNAVRRQFLAKEGAISKQDAELAQTAVLTAAQTERAAIEQIRTEQQAVEAARGRVAAQKALVAQTKERQTYARLTSPIKGVVIARVSEPGNLVQPGNEILKLGDFNRVKIDVPVSELELSNIKVGQSVEVLLDAFPKETFSGVVSRISPTADATARLIPVEIIIPNDSGKIGSGLLARVNFSQLTQPKVIVPQTALVVEGGAREQGSRGATAPSNQSSANSTSPPAPLLQGEGSKSNTPPFPAREGGAGGLGSSAPSTIFIVTGEGREAKVSARQVQIGDRANGKVEILSGLNVGERYVIRSGKPLKDGETVRLSVLSEK